MDSTPYVRKPFVVQVTEITKENFEECAKYIGDVIVPDEGDTYILVDKRRVPGVHKVYPGFYMTKLGNNIRCYSRKIFNDQFVPLTDDIQSWIDYLNGNVARSHDDPETTAVEAPQPDVEVGAYGRVIESGETADS